MTHATFTGTPPAPKTLLQLAEDYEAAVAKESELATALHTAKEAEKKARSDLEVAFVAVCGPHYRGMPYASEIAPLVRRIAEELGRKP